jgi:hypothetical protein
LRACSCRRRRPCCLVSHSDILKALHLYTYCRYVRCQFQVFRAQRPSAHISCIFCPASILTRSHNQDPMNPSPPALSSSGQSVDLSRRSKGGATGVYLKGSPELSYGLGIASTQMATAQVRCSNGDVYNESIS